MKYTPITETETDAVFQAEKGWTKDKTTFGGGEFVYTYPLRKLPGVVVKVYSSVNASTKVSRSAGQDAIRVCAVDQARNRGLRRSVRIHRTEGWQTRVKGRVLSMIADLSK